MATITLGRQTCGSLDAGSAREWLLADGLGGYAMGTVTGLRTRRYHGLLVVATAPPSGRHLGLAAVDPVLVIGDRWVELATHEWADGAIAPRGNEHLDRFDLIDGVPRWQWSIGPISLQLEVATPHGRSAVVTEWTLLSDGGFASIRLELAALCTWRDVHGERGAAGEPDIKATADGFVFEGAYRVRGPGFEPAGAWYRGVHHRVEAERGLAATEDLWLAGRFTTDLRGGERCSVDAWSGDLDLPPAPAATVIEARRARCRVLANRCGAASRSCELLTHAADQFIVAGSSGPTVVAGYPWFGDWSRDTMTSYEGLFLDTGRADEGRELLIAAAATVSEGMLANTADAGGTEYNTIDGSLWFLYAVGRHVARVWDHDLAVALLPTMRAIVDHHVAGTRFGIRVDDDGLVTGGADGWALTWMDARVDGLPITHRRGKPVEVNALWIAGLDALTRMATTVGREPRYEHLRATAQESFERRFVRPDGQGLFDVVDSPYLSEDAAIRPNQLLAASLLGGPLQTDCEAHASVLHATAPLVTSLGLRSLAPEGAAYRRSHRGGPSERDAAYHQGTVWPWLIGPYTDVVAATGGDSLRLLAGLEAHLDEWGLGSVSETSDGDPPHAATGCPFQAWSVAETLRALRKASR